MINKPLVSIITPLFNSEKYIAETIESVISQTYDNWELIIINDCSSDNGRDIVLNYLYDKRVVLIDLNHNVGPAKSRNHGIKISKGRYLSFLDSDDIWLRNKLEIQVSFMLENNLGFTYCRYNRINEDGEFIGFPKSFIELPTFKELTYNCMIGCLTVMLDRKIYNNIEFPNIIKRQDHGLWLNLFKAGLQPHGINKVLAKYRVRRNSVSSNKVIAAKYQWKLYREIMNFNMLYSAICLIKYFFNGIKNRL